MPVIESCPLPEEALLRRYASERNHTDCYTIALPGTIRLAAFVAAFYSSPCFLPERRLLATCAKAPAGDAEAWALANGNALHFSIWRVEAREENQLLMAESLFNTRSWFMVRPTESGGTTLCFGSAVIDCHRPAVRLLQGFHHRYSRLLLASACKRLA